MTKSSSNTNTSYNQNQQTTERLNQSQTEQQSQYGTQNVTGTGSALQTQTGTQTGTTGPWAQAQPTLYGLLSGVNTQLANTGLSENEQSAINQLLQNAGNLPNWQPQATDLTNRFISGDPTGLLNPALQDYRTQLSPIANADLDPMKTPGLQNYLSTVQNDITNQIRGQFAGAGRDFSGLEQQAIGRGVTQGLAPTIFNQYNQNVANRQNAASALFGGAGSVAGAMTGNYAQAPDFAQYAAQAGNTGANATLAAEALRRGIPLDQLQALSGISVPIAGLGNQTTQQTQQTGTTQTQEQQLTESSQFAQAVADMIANASGTSKTSGTQNSQTTTSPSLLSSILGIASLFKK